MKDLYNNIVGAAVLDPIAVAATGNVADIDLAGFDSAVLFVHLGLDAGTGLGESHNLAFTLYHADDDGTGSADTYAAVAAKDVLGVTPSSGVILTVDSTDEDNALYQFGYVGGKRFLKIVYTETGTVNCPIGIIVVKGHPQDVPAIS